MPSGPFQQAIDSVLLTGSGFQMLDWNQPKLCRMLRNRLFRTVRYATFSRRTPLLNVMNQSDQSDQNRSDFFLVLGYFPIAVRLLDADTEKASLSSRLLPEASIETWHELQVKKVNVSGKGVFFETTEKYQHGDLLEIKMFLEQILSDMILAYGEVVRVERYPRHFGVAVEFVGMHQKELSVITAYVLNRERELISEKRVGWL